MPHGYMWGLAECIDEAGQFARAIFHEPERWMEAGLDLDADPGALAEELADVLIPLLTLAAILQVDVLEMAREKATQDVARGVR